MAMNVYAALTDNNGPLSGDVTMGTIGEIDVSADHVEIYSLFFGTTISSEGQAHRISAHRRIEPIRFEKRIDQTTPGLYQALKQNYRLDGDFKLFDTDPDSGVTRHRFTVRVTQARILSIKSGSPDAFDADESNRPATEIVSIVPHQIDYIDEVFSKEFSDVWSEAT